MKRKKLASDVAASLDHFCKSTCRIKELKWETLHPRIYDNNRKILSPNTTFQ